MVDTRVLKTLGRNARAGSSPASATLTMASCWNGIQGGLKNRCSKGRVGSSPTEATLIMAP
jgi:hypothetical protein